MHANPFGKTQLRKALLKERLSLSQALWQQKSLQICAYLHRSPEFLQAQVILTYASLKQEPDLSSLVQSYPNKIWGLPRCVGKEINWHQWRWGDRLQPGTYGILEPLPTAPDLEAPDIDLIWVPSVACDRRFYRLGYGGGYFDRLFSLPEWSSIVRVGIVFEQAYLPQVPEDPWDIPLNAVCTENGYYRPS